MMLDKPINPIEYARGRKENPVIVAAIAVSADKIGRRVFQPYNFIAAYAVHRALFGALARRNLLPSSYEPAAHVEGGLNLSAYFFEVTQLAPALEAVKEELRAILLPDDFVAVGYWCPEEQIYRPWHPNPPPFDLHECIETVNWQGIADEADQWRADIKAAIAAESKAQQARQDQHGNETPS